MIFDTFGNFENKKCLFIHGMLSNGKSMKTFTKYFFNYYVINVTLDSHHANSEMIESKYIEAKKIIDYLHQNNINEIELLHGTSMGAMIAFELSIVSDIKINHIFLDGGPFFKLPNLVCNIFKRNIKRMVSNYLSKAKEELLNDKVIKDMLKNCSEDLDELYEDYVSIFKNYLDKDCLDKIVNISYKFDFPQIEDSSKYVFFYSKKEPAAKALHKLKKRYVNAKFIATIKTKKHCEFQTNSPSEYAAMLLNIIS